MGYIKAAACHGIEEFANTSLVVFGEVLVFFVVQPVIWVDGEVGLVMG